MGARKMNPAELQPGGALENVQSDDLNSSILPHPILNAKPSPHHDGKKHYTLHKMPDGYWLVYWPAGPRCAEYLGPNKGGAMQAMREIVGNGLLHSWVSE